MNQTIADRLRRAIKAVIKQKRIGTYELASEAGMSYSTLNNFLKGDSDMTTMKVEQIADALGYTVVGLINYRGK